MMNPNFGKGLVQVNWGWSWGTGALYERGAFYIKDPAWDMYQIVGFRTTHWRPK